MNLKTSLFNRMIIKSDLKRFWWVSALNTLAILIFGIYSQFEKYFRPSYYSYGYIPDISTEFHYSAMHGVLSISVPILIAFCGFTAVMLSLYLNSQNSVSFMHGLPIGRKTHFISHYTAGLFLIITPVLVNGIILLFMKLNPAISAVLEISHILKWLYMYVLYALVVYSGTVFVSQLTGNAFSTIGITIGIATLPLIISAFFMTIFERNVYGYYSFNMMEWLEYVYLSPDKLEKPYLLIYVALILILVVSSYFIYKKRNLENNGEIIAFAKLKPVFIYSVAVILGFLGYMYCMAISNSNSMWWILPFGILGVIIAYMLSKKAFTIKGAIKPASIFTICFLIFFLTIKFDISGYERRIPKLNNIASVQVDNKRTERTYLPAGGEVIFDEIAMPVLTQKEEIENVISLHKYLIENREISANKSYISVPLIYNLNNGKTIKRIYNIPIEECKAYLKKLYETDSMKKFDYTVFDDTKKEVIEVCVSDKRISNSLVYKNDNPEMIERLTEAFKKDIENLKYEDNYERNRFVLRGHTSIMFRHIKPAKKQNGVSLTKDEMEIISRQNVYNINDNYVNTVNLLRELGFYDGHPNAYDISVIGLTAYMRNDNGMLISDNYYKPEEVYTYSEDNNRINEIISNYKHKITEKEEIEKIFNYISNEAIYQTNYGYNSIDFAIAGENHVFQVQLEINNDIPEFLRKYIE